MTQHTRRFLDRSKSRHHADVVAARFIVKQNLDLLANNQSEEAKTMKSQLEVAHEDLVAKEEAFTPSL